MRPLGLALLAAAAFAAGCNPNPYCLNCGSTDGGSGDTGVPRDLAGTDGAGSGGDGMTMVDLAGTGDMSCNPAQLMKDPSNCGMCGHVCSYVNAFGVCTNGVCSQGACQPGYYDLNKMDTDGCEYACIPSNGGVELCDGLDNNCDGKVDEGFNLTNDAMNCGSCGNACTFPNGTGACVNSACTLASCDPGFIDLNGKGGDGCEYMCTKTNGGVEICDGKDNDCDGNIDNGVTDVGVACDDFCPPLAACVANNSCAFALSACAGKCCGQCTQGSTICAGGQKVCQMGMGPTLESCNGKDDNCDGQIDEGFDLKTDPLNCGMCGKVCALPNAIAGCANSACTIVSCKPGFADLDKNPANGCEYGCPVNPPTIETCNGKDDDCNGLVDDALTTPANFCNQTSICAGAKAVCCGAAGWLCNYPQVNAHIEVQNPMACQGGTMGATLSLSEKLCDGFDGNCNTQIDESFPNKGKPCSVGNGLCAGNGVFVCAANMMSTTCPAVANPNAAIDEKCNGIDDDCDGQVDERVPVNGSMCFNAGQHACVGWIDPMAHVTGGAGSYYMYRYEASHPDATGAAVGSNTARACSNVGALPWAPVTETQAAAACAAIKDSAGVAMRLCTAPEWQQACNLGIATNPVWSYQTTPTTYNGATCNGFDKGLAKAWATGSAAACIANPANQTGGVTASASLFDMSGNVAEWTSTQVMSNGTTYYQVKGGAYNNFANGISCDFSFTIELPSYQFADLGYRCCSNNAP